MYQSVRQILSVLVVALTLCIGTEAAANQYEIFAGFLLDNSGAPLVGQVSINSQTQTTAADGYFEIVVPTDANQKYRINAHKVGYLPYSVVHIGLAIEAMEIRLKKAEVFTIDPRQPINVTDSRGTNISIPAGAMVNAAGVPATGPLQLSLYTYDLRNEQMVGDMTAIDSTGATVALQSVGAFSAEFTDAQGNFYNLAPGQKATISMRTDPANTFSGSIPLWWYDTTRNIWVEEGAGNVANGAATGQVGHFSLWNFDMKFSDPACVKLTVDSAFFSNNLQSDGLFHMRATIRAPFYRSYLLRVDRALPSKHVLYNLATNATIEFTAFVMKRNADGTPFRDSSGNLVFEEKPYALVNSGAPWGGVGAPRLTQYDMCKGSLHVDGVYKASQLKGRLLRQGRTSGHGSTSVQVVGTSGSFNAVTDHNGDFSLLVPVESLTITASRPNYLSLRKSGQSVSGGNVTQLSAVSLPAGDVDDDDVVEPSDVSAILNAITTPPTSVSSSDPRDINGNLVIDWTDAQIATGNGGLASPQPWP
jgi:hypothetical protein